MDENLSEKEQIERLKKWWVDNYKSILTGVIIAGAIIFGWRWWQHRVLVRSLTASTMYNEMGSLLSANNGPSALKVASELINKYDDTPYASQAALAMAEYDVGTRKPDDAMQMLNWVINNSKDASLKLLARLRLARVKLMVDDPQAALVALNVAHPGGFAALYDDLRGDAYVKLGQLGKARAAYRQALDEWKPEMGDKSLVQMKLDNLTAAKGATASPSSTPHAQAGAKQP